jgi:flagellar motor switch protein FliG
MSASTRTEAERSERFESEQTSSVPSLVNKHHETDPGPRIDVSGPQKAAILLLSLGERISSRVLKNLPLTQAKQVVQAMSELGAISAEVADRVVEESYQKLRDGRLSLKGDLDFVRKVAEAAFDPKQVQGLLRFLSGDALSLEDSLNTIRFADPLVVAQLIEKEHPQTVAVLLSLLDPDRASAVIRSLPADLRRESTLRLAMMERVSQPVRNRLIATVAEQLTQHSRPDSHLMGGARKAAEILNQMEQDSSLRTLEEIEEQDDELAVSIRELMFVFDDLLRLSRTDMRMLLSNLDKKDLAQALKGTSPEMKEHFWTNLSQRAGEMLKEDMDALGPMRMKDVESARQRILETVRDLEASGEITTRTSDSDQYVD